ncbi:MAG: SCP2 sterol-binding domain-containing protein [Acidimicrobiales bacterium]
MPHFLSPEWISAFNAAVENAQIPEPDAPSLAGTHSHFTICQIVTAGPERGDIHTVLEVTADRLHMTLLTDQNGSSDTERCDADKTRSCDVTITLDWNAAVALSRGEVSPVEALTAGKVHVRGNVTVLGEVHQLLDAARPYLHDLSRSTTY